MKSKLLCKNLGVKVGGVYSKGLISRRLVYPFTESISMQFTQLTHQCMSHKLPVMVEVSYNAQWDDHISTIKAVVALTEFPLT